MIRIPIAKLDELKEDVVKICPISIPPFSIPPDQEEHITGVATECALVLHEARCYAIGSICPHQNAPFQGKCVERDQIICRRHGFAFYLTTGECSTLGGYGIPTFPVEIEEGIVYIHV